jgi:hypothetical protein
MLHLQFYHAICNGFFFSFIFVVIGWGWEVDKAARCAKRNKPFFFVKMHKWKTLDELSGFAPWSKVGGGDVKYVALNYLLIFPQNWKGILSKWEVSRGISPSYLLSDAQQICSPTSIDSETNCQKERLKQIPSPFPYLGHLVQEIWLRLITFCQRSRITCT